MNLLWKEFRESYPVVLLGLGVTFILALQPILAGEPRYYGVNWGYGFCYGGQAILLFVALVLGVTAYAVEEEQDTLQPLLAKPVSVHDVMASKLGVRLGLIFAAVVLFGLVQLITEAWPIAWDIPAPWAFQRWLGTLAVCLAGFGLGLYFGKIRGQQTVALLIAALLIGAGFVLLNFTPLKFLFENHDGLTRIAWIREILIPFLTGAAAVLAAIGLPAEHRRMLPAGWLAALALAGYGLLIWSLTLLPFGQVWNNPQSYKQFWTLRFGDPQTALHVLADRMYDPRDAEELDVDRSLWLLERVGYISPRRPAAGVYTYTTLLGPEPYEYRPVSSSPVRARDEGESFFIEHRREAEVRDLLELSLTRGLPEFERMVILHVAGVLDDTLHTELIAAHMDDPAPSVRGLAAMLLIGRNDERGRRALADMLTGAPFTLIDSAAQLERYYRYPISLRVGELMRTWLRLPPDLQPEEAVRYLEQFPWSIGTGRHSIEGFRNVAQIWVAYLGTPDDLPALRYSLWAEMSPQERSRTSPEDVDVWQQLGWSELPIMREAGSPTVSEVRALADRLSVNFEENRALMQLDRRRGSSRYWRLYHDFSGRLALMRRWMNAIFDRRDPDALQLWRETRRYYDVALRGSSYRGNELLPKMVALGEEGIAELEHLMLDPKEQPEIRFQAALILAGEDMPGADRTALHLWTLYEPSASGMASYFWPNDSLTAFRRLLERGNLIFAGPIIEVANKALQDREGLRYRWYGEVVNIGRTIGPSYWNNSITKALREASGQDYGWDLKAWTKWWEREKVRLGYGN